MICGIICQDVVAGAGAETTWNPSDKHPDITLSDGDLIATQTTTGNFRNVRGTVGYDTGKRYFECRLNAGSSAAEIIVIGLGTASASLSNFISLTGGSAYSGGLAADGNAYDGPSGGLGSGVDVGKPVAVAEWAGLAVDFAASKAWVRDATGWAGDPEAGTGNSLTLPGNVLYPMVGGFTTGDEIEANFGASAFAYAIPSGFISWDAAGGAEGEAVASAAGVGAALGISESAGVAEAAGIGDSAVVGASINAGDAAAAGIGDSAVVGSSVTAGPHRYWRIFAETNNGEANFIGISEIEFQEDSFSGANVLTGGTISASSQASGTYVASEAIDGVYHVTADDRWASSSTGGTNEWIKYDFGASNDKEINSVTLWSLSSSAFNQSIKDFRVEHSDDDSSWTTLWTDTFTCSGNQQWLRSTNTGHETPANTGAPYGSHSYWRCYIQTGNGALSCAEMEMRATPGGADQCSGGTPSVLSSAVGTASSIFDNNNATHWAQNGGVNWIQYQFASPVSVAEIAWRIRGDSNPTHSPNDFIVQFSDNGTTWATAWFVMNQSGWTNGEQRTFTSPDYA